MQCNVMIVLQTAAGEAVVLVVLDPTMVEIMVVVQWKVAPADTLLVARDLMEVGTGWALASGTLKCHIAQ